MSQSKRARSEEESKKGDDSWKNEPPYAKSKDHDENPVIHKGSCHCKDVTFEIRAKEPKGSHFCHCNVCQKLHGSAMHWSVVLEKPQVLFTCSPDKLSFYRTTDQKTHHEPPCKLSCARCHSPIADEGRNMMLMYPSLWDMNDRSEREAWLPDKHIFYTQRIIDIEDGKDKWTKMQDESEKVSETEEHGKSGTVGSNSK